MHWFCCSSFTATVWSICKLTTREEGCKSLCGRQAGRHGCMIAGILPLGRCSDPLDTQQDKNKGLIFLGISVRWNAFEAVGKSVHTFLQDRGKAGCLDLKNMCERCTVNKKWACEISTLEDNLHPGMTVLLQFALLFLSHWVLKLLVNLKRWECLFLK